MQMVIFTMDIGLMIKLMESESTSILTEPSMKVSGKKINNMVKV